MERLRLALYNKNGMTLIEILISIVILTVVALAVMQSALVSVNTNLQNSLRDEAVNVVDLRMNELRSATTGTFFDGNALALGTNTEPAISRNFRAFSANYAPTREVLSINADMKQITMSVAWTFRGQAYTHSVTTIMRRQ